MYALPPHLLNQSLGLQRPAARYPAIDASRSSSLHTDMHIRRVPCRLTTKDRHLLAHRDPTVRESPRPGAVALLPQDERMSRLAVEDPRPTIARLARRKKRFVPGECKPTLTALDRLTPPALPRDDLSDARVGTRSLQ